MGCCGRREKGFTVTEEQKWDYIVCISLQLKVPRSKADPHPARHSLTSSRGPASHLSPTYGCGSSSSSPYRFTLLTPSLPSIYLLSTNGPARSNQKSVSTWPSGSSLYASSSPTSSWYTDGLGQSKSFALAVCRRATSNRSPPSSKVCVSQKVAKVGRGSWSSLN